MKTFKRLLVSLLCVAMVLTSAPLSGFVGLKFPGLKLPEWNLFDFSLKSEAATYSGSCGATSSDNVNWSLDTSTGVLNITGTGAMKDYSSSSNAPWYSYCDYIETVNFSEGVTHIGSYAFYYCYCITSVSIPSSVKSMGSGSFYIYVSNNKLTDVYYAGDIESWCDISIENNYATPMCYAKNFYVNNTVLKELVIPDTVTEIKNNTFNGFKRVLSVEIHDGVTSIGHGAFRDCTRLVEITIGNSVTSIDNYAFEGCTSLTSITIPNCVAVIGSCVFEGCTNLTSMTIPDSVTKVGENAFQNCTSLASVTFGNGITYIDKYFDGCTNLTSVTLPDSVTSIWADAFYKCTSLTSITLPDSVTSIGADAFYKCTSLKSIVIGKGVTNIKSDAFNECTNLTNVYYTGDVESWCNISLANRYANPMYYAKNFYINNVLLKEVIIPDTITEIKNFAFFGFGNIISVTIGDSVTSIGGMAFYECTNLTTVTIGDRVESIGINVFAQCTRLISVVIGDRVKSIPDWTFFNCQYLEMVTIPKSVTSIDYSAFGGCDSLKYVAYAGTKEEWKIISIDTNNTDLTLARRFYETSTLEYITEKGIKYFVTDKIVEVVSSSITDSQVVIPEKFDGKPVIKIDAGAFKENTTITSIKIPGSVVSIGTSAFEFCKKLVSVEIGDGVTSIGNDAFRYCTSLTSITLPDSVTSIGAEAFYKCTSLTSIALPDSVTSIGDSVFRNCTSLTSITLPDSVTSIGDYAFENCTSLTSITLPDSVKRIGSFAFRDCAKLTSVIIPDGVTSISSYIFKGCTSLVSVVIPDSVEYIGNGAFKDCSMLSEVFYTGLELEWKTISIGSDNESLESAKKYYKHVHCYNEIIDIPSTCQTNGRNILTCECGKVSGYVTAPLLEHTMSESEIIKEATCSETGEMKCLCAVCGETYIEEITKLNHTPDNAVEENRKEPDCTNDGGYDTVVYCTVCSEEVSREKVTVTEALGHTESKPVEENKVEPTCTEKGSFDSVVYCSVCNEELSRELNSISAKGHKWGNWEVTTQPTMVTDGVKTRECLSCGENETGVEPKTGITVIFTDSNGTVISEQVIEGDLTECTFEGVEDGEYTVTVSKETYVSRDYVITATGGKAECEFKLNHVGDINGDGKVSLIDYTQLLRHVKKTSSLDGYAFDCADVNGDGKLSLLDYTKLLRHVKKTEVLW